MVINFEEKSTLNEFEKKKHSEELDKKPGKSKETETDKMSSILKHYTFSNPSSNDNKPRKEIPSPYKIG